jgi:pimeloyl-ACP methyl ester carboxylesterase
MTQGKKSAFLKFIRKVIKYTALFFVLYAALRIGSSNLRQRADETALAHLYAGYRALPEKPVTMFIPGMMASVLKDKDTGRVIYGNVFQGLIEELELPIDGKTLRDNQDEVVAGTVVRTFKYIPGVLELDLNDRVQQVALKIGGFKIGQDGFSFGWDWRRDMVEAAQNLDRTIQELKVKLGKPDLKINLLCHSAGGLVARYYAKYGAKDVLDDPAPVPTYEGAKNINKIIMMGTPNTGSVESFMTVHDGVWLPSVGRATAEMIFSMPALYELMPLEGKKVFIDAGGKPLDIDLHDPKNWETYGWSVFDPERQAKARMELKKLHGEVEGEKKFQEKLVLQRRFIVLMLARAKKFREALWAGDPVEEKQKIHYVVFGGDRALTLQAAILGRDEKGQWKTTFKTKRSDVEDALYSYGDMSVTKESVLGRHAVEIGGQIGTRQLPADHSVFFFQNHVSMPKDMTFLDNVLHSVFEDYEPVVAPKQKQRPLQKLAEWVLK